MSKMTQIATLFAAGSFLAATATPLGASPVPTTTSTAAMEAFGSCGAGSCGGKDAKADKDKKATDTKKATKKGAKEGSCGAGSCGGKMKKGEKKAEAPAKEAEAPAKQ